MHSCFSSKKKSDFAYFMEDVIDVLIRMFIWILIISITIIVIYETPNIYALDDITGNYSCAINNFYVNEDSSVDDAKMLNEFVESLPPVFIREFRNDWRVIIDDCVFYPTGFPNNVIISGYTDWDSRIIFIRKEANSADTLDTFVHELGHCFDFEYGSVSYSEFFNDVYDFYKDDFTEQYTNSPIGYSTSSAVEFFAACFKEYMLYPEHLKTVAPKAYNFVDNFYENIQTIKYIYIYDFGAVANIASRFAG